MPRDAVYRASPLTTSDGPVRPTEGRVLFAATGRFAPLMVPGTTARSSRPVAAKIFPVKGGIREGRWYNALRGQI